MRHLQTSGTLGDAWITALKLSTLQEEAILHHTCSTRGVELGYWHSDIEALLRLVPQVREVRFEPALTAYERVYSRAITVGDPPGIGINFYADLLAGKTGPKLNDPGPYWALQVNAGKPRDHGDNALVMDHPLVDRLLELIPGTSVLVGTDPEHREPANPRNLVGKTTLQESLCCVRGAVGFVGPVGLLGFVALTYRRPTYLFISDPFSLAAYLLGTPWESTLHLRLPTRPPREARLMDTLASTLDDSFRG